MKTFAVLNGENVVTNIIVCDSLEIAEQVTQCVCVEYTKENPASIGWIYDPATNTFSPPKPPAK